MNYAQSYAANEHDDEDVFEEPKNITSLVLWVVDASAAMHVKKPKESSLFEMVCTHLYNSFKETIVQNTKQYMGVVLYNTATTENPTSTNFVYQVMSPKMITAKCIKTMKELPKTFSNIGSAPAGSSVDLLDLMHCCQMVMAVGDVRKKKFNEKIINFATANDHPHATNIRAALNQRDEMNESGIYFTVYQLKADWDKKSIWQQIHTSFEDDPVTGIKLEALGREVRKREFPKRSVASINLKVYDGIDIAVKIYCAVRSAGLPKHSLHHARTSKPLVSKSRQVCADTKTVLTDNQIEYFHLFGKEKAFFKKEEITKIKTIGEPGLVLMGFKPRSRLKDWHNVRASYFVHPDETTIIGSSVAFHALVNAMEEMKFVAIFLFKPRSNGYPRFVAGIPLVEKPVKDDDGNTTDNFEHGGMNLIFLPYSDDIRFQNVKPFIKEEDDDEERVQVEADHDLVSSMRAIINRSVDLENNGEPEPEQVSLIEDPQKKRFYAVLEAIALSEPIPDRKVDPTLPEKELWKTLEEEKFLDKFFSKLPEAEPEVKGKKRTRKSSSKSGSNKKAKLEPGAKEEASDVESRARNGTLKKCKNVELKAFLKSKELSTKGKKADLMDRVLDFFGL